MIEELIKTIPESIMESLGGVFCSGREAFSGQKIFMFWGLTQVACQMLSMVVPFRKA